MLIDIFLVMDSEKPDMPDQNLSTNTKGTKNRQLIHKNFQAQQNCVCKRECAKNIGIDQQRAIFERFSKLHKYSNQTQFLRGLVITKPTKTNLEPIINLKNRNVAYDYHLTNEDGLLTPVCQSFFINVLQINKNKVQRAVSSACKNPTAIERRGRLKKKRVDNVDVKYLKDFIGKFVTYASSCNSAKSHIKYLHPRLTMRRMYQLYQENCVSENRNILSDTSFRKILKSDFNLKLFTFAKPKCKACNSMDKIPGRFVRNIAAFEKQETEKTEHLKLLEEVKSDLFHHVENALEENSMVFTFELRHSCDLPYLTTDGNGDMFFKKQLWLYCFCVYDEVTQNGYFYVWNESQASRGSDEIASCLYKHFMNYVPKEIRKIILFSDVHLNQNRNIKLSMMLHKYLDFCEGKTELSSIE